MSPRRATPEKKQDGLPQWVIFGAVAIVAIIGVVGIVQIMGAIQSPAPVPSSILSGITREGRTQGDPKASITFIEFSDFQ